MDPFTMMLLGSGIGAAGNIGGGLLAGLFGGGNQGPTQNQLKDAPSAGYQSSANPIVNALQMALLGGLGQPVGQLAQQASPIAQLQNAASSGTLGLVQQRNAAQLNEGMRVVQGILSGNLPAAGVNGRNLGELPEGFDPRSASTDELVALATQFMTPQSRLMLESAAAAAGVGTIRDLIDQERTFRTQVEQVTPQLEAIARQNLEARGLGSQMSLDILRDYPRATQTDINRLSEIERQRMREEVLQASNVAGVNPSAGLAEVARDVNPIARAVALLGGSQSLAQNQYNLGTQAQFGPVELAIGGSSPLLAAAQGQGSIAAQQANTIAGFGAPSNQDMGGTLGTGFAAGLGQLGSGFNMLSMLDLLRQSQGGGAASPSSTQGGGFGL